MYEKLLDDLAELYKNNNQLNIIPRAIDAIKSLNEQLSAAIAGQITLQNYFISELDRRDNDGSEYTE